MAAPSFLVSADDDIDLDKEEKKFRLLGRVVMFLLINGPTTVLALGLWIKIGKSSAGGGTWMKMAFVVWIVGLIGSALAIFKK